MVEWISMDVETKCIHIYMSFIIYRANGLQSVRERLESWTPLEIKNMIWVMLCISVNMYRSLRGTNCLHLLPWRWRQWIIPNIGVYIPNYMASHLRRLQSSDSPPRELLTSVMNVSYFIPCLFITCYNQYVSTSKHCKIIYFQSWKDWNAYTCCVLWKTFWCVRNLFVPLKYN